MALFKTLWDLLPPLDDGASVIITDPDLNKLITQRFSDSRPCPWYVRYKPLGLTFSWGFGSSRWTISRE